MLEELRESDEIEIGNKVIPYFGIDLRYIELQLYVSDFTLLNEKSPDLTQEEERNLQISSNTLERELGSNFIVAANLAKTPTLDPILRDKFKRQTDQIVREYQLAREFWLSTLIEGNLAAYPKMMKDIARTARMREPVQVTYRLITTIEEEDPTKIAAIRTLARQMGYRVADIVEDEKGIKTFTISPMKTEY